MTAFGMPSNFGSPSSYIPLYEKEVCPGGGEHCFYEEQEVDLEMSEKVDSVITKGTGMYRCRKCGETK